MDDSYYSNIAKSSLGMMKEQRTLLERDWGKGGELLVGGFGKGTATFEKFNTAKKIPKKKIDLTDIMGMLLTMMGRAGGDNQDTS